MVLIKAALGWVSVANWSVRPIADLKMLFTWCSTGLAVRFICTLGMLGLLVRV